jgi:hypothetical protein
LRDVARTTPRVFVQNLYLRLGPRRCGPPPWRARVFLRSSNRNDAARIRANSPLAARPAPLRASAADAGFCRNRLNCSSHSQDRNARTECRLNLCYFSATACTRPRTLLFTRDNSFTAIPRTKNAPSAPAHRAQRIVLSDYVNLVKADSRALPTAGVTTSSLTRTASCCAIRDLASS